MSSPRSLGHRLAHAAGVGGVSPRALGLLGALVWAGVVPALATGAGLASLLGLPARSGQVLDLGVVVALALGLAVAPLRARAGQRHLRLRMGLGAAGLAVATLLALPTLHEPMTALVMGTGALLWLGALAGGQVDPSAPPPVPGRGALAAAEGARVGAGLAWLLLSATGAGGPGVRVALVGAIACAWGWDRLLGTVGADPGRRVMWAVPPLLLLVLVPGFDPLLAAVPALALVIVGPPATIERAATRALTPEQRRAAQLEGRFGRIMGDPTRALVLTFIVGGLVGAALLAMPAASRGAGGHRFIDALFTSFSAICVTGLGVLDTPTAFGGFGQLIILLLIQVGGLGIMAFSTAGLVLMGERLSLRQEAAAAELLNTRSRERLRDDLFAVFRITFACEGIGALILSVLFWLQGDGIGAGLWRGVFTAISAFCNAGFALQSDSLVGYQTAPGVLLTVAGLIVAGGLGPMAVAASAVWGRERVSARLRTVRPGPPPGRWIRGASRAAPTPALPVSPQVRLVLVLALGLIVVPTAFILVTEWSGSLDHLDPLDRLVNAFFQSVTLRTAGFNSIDLTAVHSATYALMIPLMFIGGSPGSTAGGIKTTTVAVLAALVRSAFRQDARASLWGHQLDMATVRKAAAVATLGLVSVFVLLLALLLTQPLSLELALFEAVSALGTVGLTVGGTAQLDDVGKLLVSVAMLAGRVGPLSLLMVLRDQPSRTAHIDTPRLGVDIG